MAPPDFPNKKPTGQDQLKPYLQYSGMAVQMVVVLVVAAYGGKKLDQYMALKYPVFTIVLMLVGVVVSMYMVVASVMKNK